MVIENRVSLIMMLCQEEENGKDMSLKYYESKEGNAVFGLYEIKVLEQKEEMPGLLVRKLSVSKNGSEVRKVTHV